MKRYRLLQNKSGFSLIETVVAMLLVVLMSGMMVTGIRLAVKVYTTVVDKANAQVLLTTTETILRNELSSAKKITVKDDTVSYQNSVTGQSWELSSPDTDIIRKLNKPDGTTKEDRLIQETTGTINLHIRFDKIELFAEGRYIKVSGLRVTKGTQTLAGSETYTYCIGVE